MVSSSFGNEQPSSTFKVLRVVTAATHQTEVPSPISGSLSPLDRELGSAREC